MNVIKSFKFLTSSDFQPRSYMTHSIFLSWIHDIENSQYGYVLMVLPMNDCSKFCWFIRFRSEMKQLQLYWWDVFSSCQNTSVFDKCHACKFHLCNQAFGEVLQLTFIPCVYVNMPFCFLFSDGKNDFLFPSCFLCVDEHQFGNKQSSALVVIRYSMHQCP